GRLGRFESYFRGSGNLMLLCGNLRSLCCVCTFFQIARPSVACAATVRRTAWRERRWINRDSVYQLITAGKVKTSKLGRRRIVHTASILRLLEETAAPQPSSAL